MISKILSFLKIKRNVKVVLISRFGKQPSFLLDEDTKVQEIIKLISTRARVLKSMVNLFLFNEKSYQSVGVSEKLKEISNKDGIVSFWLEITEPPSINIFVKFNGVNSFSLSPLVFPAESQLKQVIKHVTDTIGCRPDEIICADCTIYSVPISSLSRGKTELELHLFIGRKCTFFFNDTRNTKEIDSFFPFQTIQEFLTLKNIPKDTKITCEDIFVDPNNFIGKYDGGLLEFHIESLIYFSVDNSSMFLLNCGKMTVEEAKIPLLEYLFSHGFKFPVDQEINLLDQNKMKLRGKTVLNTIQMDNRECIEISYKRMYKIIFQNKEELAHEYFNYQMISDVKLFIEKVYDITSHSIKLSNFKGVEYDDDAFLAATNVDTYYVQLIARKPQLIVFVFDNKIIYRGKVYPYSDVADFKDGILRILDKSYIDLKFKVNNQIIPKNIRLFNIISPQTAIIDLEPISLNLNVHCSNGQNFEFVATKNSAVNDLFNEIQSRTKVDKEKITLFKNNARIISFDSKTLLKNMGFQSNDIINALFFSTKFEIEYEKDVIQFQCKKNYSIYEMKTKLSSCFHIKQNIGELNLIANKKALNENDRIFDILQNTQNINKIIISYTPHKFKCHIRFLDKDSFVSFYFPIESNKSLNEIHETIKTNFQTSIKFTFWREEEKLDEAKTFIELGINESTQLTIKSEKQIEIKKYCEVEDTGKIIVITFKPSCSFQEIKEIISKDKLIGNSEFILKLKNEMIEYIPQPESLFRNQEITSDQSLFIIEKIKEEDKDQIILQIDEFQSKIIKLNHKIIEMIKKEEKLTSETFFVFDNHILSKSNTLESYRIKDKSFVNVYTSNYLCFTDGNLLIPVKYDPTANEKIYLMMIKNINNFNIDNIRNIDQRRILLKNGEKVIEKSELANSFVNGETFFISIQNEIVYNIIFKSRVSMLRVPIDKQTVKEAISIFARDNDIKDINTIQFSDEKGNILQPNENLQEKKCDGVPIEMVKAKKVKSFSFFEGGNIIHLNLIYSTVIAAKDEIRKRLNMKESEDPISIFCNGELLRPDTLLSDYNIDYENDEFFEVELVKQETIDVKLIINKRIFMLTMKKGSTYGDIRLIALNKMEGIEFDEIVLVARNEQMSDYENVEESAKIYAMKEGEKVQMDEDDNENQEDEANSLISEVRTSVPSTTIIPSKEINSKIRANRITEEEEEEIELFKMIGIDEVERFEKIAVLGRGASGKIVEIKDKKTNKHYARKTIYDNNFQNIKEIQKENEILSLIVHPSIERIVGFTFPIGAQRYTLYLELLPYSLKTMIEKKELDELLTTRIIIEICFGLEYLLKKYEIIHRDLKAENIMLTKKKHVRICDFGKAQINSNTVSLTKGIGTFDYMSPEMLNKQPYDFKSDVYSFGILIYYLIFGSMPNMTYTDKFTKKTIPIEESVVEERKINNFCIDLIKKCCLYSSEERPTYSEILETIEENEFELFGEKFKEEEKQQIKKRFNYLKKINE